MNTIENAEIADSMQVNSTVDNWARAKDAAIGAVDSTPTAHEKVTEEFTSPQVFFPENKEPMLDSLIFTCPNCTCQVRKRRTLVSFPGVRTAGGQPRIHREHEIKYNDFPKRQFDLIVC